jgi:DNA-directed RNA polymerase subunit omega
MPPSISWLVSWLLVVEAARSRTARATTSPETGASMPPKATLMDPRMEQLLERVDSKFTLVTLAAMRAREINDYYNQLGEGLGKIVPPQVTSVSRKPLSIALEEIEADKIEAVPLPPEPTEEEVAAAEAEIAATLLAAKEAAGAESPEA